MKLEGTCIRFTLMDYNFVVKNDFGGEAYIATQQVPGVLNSIKGHQALRTAELVFMKPQNVKGKSWSCLTIGYGMTIPIIHK